MVEYRKKALIAYWLDTPFGCGGIETDRGTIVSGAPIFRKLFGTKLVDLPKHYKLIRIGAP